MRECCQTFCARASFSVEIIEVFPWTEYNNSKVCLVNRKSRLDRKIYWMKTIRTSYPYCLNLSKKKTNQSLPVGCSFSTFFQCQRKDMSDIDITPTLTTLKAWYPYLTICITISQTILRMHSIIYKYF